MLQLLVLGLLATSVLASPLQEISVGGDLLQGNFEIGAAKTGMFSSVSVDYLVEKYLNSIKNEATLEKLFNEFKQLYQKSYKSGEHEKSSKDLFLQRILMVLENNIKALHHESSYILAIQSVSDLPIEQILAQPAGNWPSAKGEIPVDGSAVNESQYANNWSFDYRQQHQVTGIVNQGSCGACVYFAAAACIESFWARKGHGMIHLSPQQLNDCARNDARGNHGCQHGGGTFVPTFDYIRDHGLASTNDYPYVAHDAACRRDKESHPAARIHAWHPVQPHGDEMALERSVHDHGPNAIAVHVSDGFAHYKSGIFEGECRGGRNHAVLAVGYGMENGKDFWIVKNQWGEHWGEHGYIRLRRKHGNLCDVAGDAVWVE